MKLRENERALRTAAGLGIDVATAEHARRERVCPLAAAAQRLRAELKPGSVTLITGPSGAGKSTLLRLFARGGGTVTVKPLTRTQEKTRVAGLSARTPLRRWTRLLAGFGMAESRLLVLRAGDLSVGERARLELALAAARAEAQERVSFLIVDEWCSVLDRATARSVAIGAARWARKRVVCLVGATAREDLAAIVQADVMLKLDEHGGVEWTRCGLSMAS